MTEDHMLSNAFDAEHLELHQKVIEEILERERRWAELADGGTYEFVAGEYKRPS